MPLFINGEATPEFSYLLNSVGYPWTTEKELNDNEIDQSEKNKESAIKIEDAFKILDKNCFQKNPAFFEKSESDVSKNMTFEQAKDFSEYEFEHLKPTMPKKGSVIDSDAIFSCGVEPTMEKRRRALEESIKNQGHIYKNIYFIYKSESDKKIGELFIEKNKELLEGINCEHIETYNTLDVLEKSLPKIIEQNKNFGNNGYVIISDTSFGEKETQVARRVLNSHQFLGTASVVYGKSWEEEVKLYKYDQFFDTFEKATIQFVASKLNILTKQVNEELKEWNKKISQMKL